VYGAGLMVCVKYIVLYDLCSLNGVLQPTCLQLSPLERERERESSGEGSGETLCLVFTLLGL